jgi:hypothetical protein
LPPIAAEILLEFSSEKFQKIAAKSGTTDKKMPEVMAQKNKMAIFVVKMLVMKSPLMTSLLQTNTFEDKAIPFDQ